MASSVFKLIAQVSAGGDLESNEAQAFFEQVMAGSVDPAILGAFVCALKEKGETVGELVGAARAMRAAAMRVDCARPCLCTCGTGGDGISTFNVSTTAAFIASAAGVVVAKHGNRTNTRVSGSSEVLLALGVDIDAPVATLERCLDEIGLAFLHAPNLHPAMRHAAAVRRAVRTRTIFNLLGPLCHPGGAAYQVLGVSRPEHLDLIAGALQALGVGRAWVVHGSDGLCDLTITGPTQVVEVSRDGLKRHVVSPQAVGLAVAPLHDLLVGSPEESAAAVRAILDGEAGPRRDHAVLNAAGAMVVYGVAPNLREGVARAQAVVDEGAARRQLDRLLAICGRN